MNMKNDEMIEKLNESMNLVEITKKNINWKVFRDVLKKVVRNKKKLDSVSDEKWQSIGMMYLAKIDLLNKHNY